MNELSVIFYLYEETRKNITYIERTKYGAWIKTMLKISPLEVTISETPEGLFMVSGGETENTFCVSLHEAQEIRFQRISLHCERVHSIQKKGYTYYESYKSKLFMDCKNPDEITKMVYSRVYNPLTKMYEKVWLPISFSFSLSEEVCDFYGHQAVQMKIKEINERIDIYEKRIAEKTEESKRRLFEERAVNDELYGVNKESIFEAFKRWKEIEYVQPAPTQIRNIKKSLPFSWVELVEHIEQITEPKGNLNDC